MTGRRQRPLQPAVSPLAKLSPPRLHGVYQRRRLFRELDRLRRHSVSWVAGPAGSGKTTLIASYLQARRLRYLWYQLDAADADLASFFHDLGLAVQRVAPRRPPLPRLTPEYLLDPETFARNFFREIGRRLSGSCVLVLDNLHEAAENPRFCDVLRAGVGELASFAHVTIISRSEPPDVFARMRANRQLACLDGRELKLREQESRAVARALAARGSAPDAAEVARLHRLCDGWMAGLILLLDGARTGARHDERLDATGTQPLFDYFAAELFAHRPAATREFLMHTALLPGFTLEMAQRLTRNSGARALLNDLVRQHLFTERHAGPRASYQYHPLFREFLREQARSTWRNEELARRQRAAGDVLESMDQPEDALDLYLDAGDADSAVRLILGRASHFLATGRSGVLESAISRLPEAIVERQPWLKYWLGNCRRMANPVEARSCFEGALGAFRAAGDPDGCYLAWAGIVDCFVLTCDYSPRLRSWIAQFDALERRFRRRVRPAARDQAVCAMLTAHVFFNPEWSAIRKWLARAERIARQSADTNLRMMILAPLSLYYHWTGATARLEAIVDVARTLARSPSLGPLGRLHVLVMETQLSLLKGDPQQALLLTREAEALSTASGVHVVDQPICAYAVYAHAQMGDLDAAEAALERFRGLLAPGHQLFLAHCSYIAGYLDALRGNPQRAEEYFDTALRLARANGTPMQITMVLMSLARVSAQTGRLEEARKLLHAALSRAHAMRSHLFEFECCLVRAAIAKRVDDESESVALLRRAFALMAQHGFKTYHLWDPAFLAELCATALEGGVHVATVRELIATRGLLPPEDCIAPEQWPWPVKVRTLGRFELFVNSEPVRFEAKGRKKPLELLQALIALGGHAVFQEDLIELLWPQSEGDAAHRVFDTTLHRLRKLLLCKRAIIMRTGQVSLDARYVWLDTWALERGFKDEARRDPQSMVQVLSLYRGPFLGRETVPWALPMRDRMRSVFLRAVEQAGAFNEEHARTQDAIDCYRRGIEADPLAEPLYQHLMRCYARQARHAEALAAYERLRAMLASQLGMRPSGESRELHQRLLAEASAENRVTRRARRVARPSRR